MSTQLHADFSRLVESIGPAAALVLCAFCDGQPTLYVPGNYRAGHLLERVVGQSAFLRMVANFGGETIMLPRLHLAPERRAGAVYRGMRQGMSTQQIAADLGISYRRVRQIETAIRRGESLTVLARRGD